MVVVGHRRVAALLQPRPAEAEVLRQEAREGVQFEQGQQPAGPHRREDLVQDPVGVPHVVQRVGRPDQVQRAEPRPGVVQVGPERADPLGQAEGGGFVREAVQQFGGEVQRGDLAAGEAPGQRERAGAGAGAEVEDPGVGRVLHQPVHPVDDLGQVGVQHLGVEVQHLRQWRGVVGLAVAVLVPAGLVLVVMVVPVFVHAPTITASCANDIHSCA